MDQLKPAIEFCKKQYFWILLSMLSLMSIAGFVMTKMSLAAQLKTQQALVDSKYGSVQEVSGKASTHPNESSHARMDIEIKKVADDVRKAWEFQYTRQIGIMQWPASLDKDFIDAVDKLRPIESLAFPLTEQADPVAAPLRERFRDYVDPLFPRLAQIIGANWEATVDDITPGGGSAGGGSAGGIGAPSGGGGRGGPGGMDPGGMMGSPDSAAAAGPKPLVYWQPASQKELMSSVLWWYDKKKAPSTLEILYTQEDLWIIEGLMNIIKATNGDARENFQASIKEIEFLRIGKSAVGRAGTLTSLGGGGGTGMMGPGGSSGMPMPGSDGGDQMDTGSSGSSAPTPGSGGMEGMLDGAMDGGTTTQSSPDPAAGRYVDTAFQPINGETLRTVVNSGALNPTDAPLAVAKRIPVRMRFVMDQRKLNRLLTECGNADLLFEVRQVRINTEAHGDAGLGGMMGGSGGRAGPQLGGSAGTPGLGAPDDGGASSGGGGSVTAGLTKSYDLPVEIYGVVYLFNKVDMNKLGLENVTADTQIENVGRVSAEESTGLEKDQSATVDGGAAAPGDAATPPGDVVAPPATPGDAATPPATPAAPDGSASGGVTPDGATPAPAGGGAAPGTPPVPSLPPAGGN